ncbi:hypothetical protein EBZ38_12940 [bacterium]|nr:hypothetical protein [bacterium]NBW78229.1 hypothetical protein [Betaproteobacteria bacterium]NDC95401.1 hypothetical protein [bacterium]NDD85163.1 hypothetical protein [bacterium]
MSDLQRIKQYALSNTDIEKILGKTKIFTYPELDDFANWEDAFDDDGRAVFLFLTEDNTTGHWIGLIRNDTTIEYFDPYGEPPEGDKKWLSKQKLRRLDQDQPLLTRFLRSTGMKVYYNQHAFQQDRNDINTCGRWVVARLLLRKKTLRQFYNFIQNSGMKGDDFVSLLTFKILGK